MPTIQEEILDEFYRKLEETKGFSGTKIKQLRNLFSAGKKPKAIEIIKVLSEPTKDDLL